jgi:hypothetical protein
MMSKITAGCAAALLPFGLSASAQAPRTTAAPPTMATQKALPQPGPGLQERPMQLTLAQQQQLQTLIAQHNQVRAQLSAADRADLDKLTSHVRQGLFAAPMRGNLLNSAIQLVSRTIPGLSPTEATSLAEYALSGMAAAEGGGGQSALMAATRSMQETQMSFNLQYLQLQSQMQHENRSYTAISNIMKTKHDTVKNSIGNIR